MKWIGLTGGLATGKSEVTKWLMAKGYKVADADKLAHQALAVGSPLVQSLVQRWGPQVLKSDQSLDRSQVAEIVFQDKAQLDFLESLVHPWIKDQIIQLKALWIKEGCKVAFYDVPLLFEKNLQEQFDFTVLVYAPAKIQIQRAYLRDGKGLDDIEKKMNNQMPIETKKALADFVIDNSGDLSELHESLEKLVSAPNFL